MRALFLKDWYMAKSYCRSYLFIVAVFAAVSFISSESLFFMAYPTIMFGILPVTLISYDERFTGRPTPARCPSAGATRCGKSTCCRCC